MVGIIKPASLANHERSSTAMIESTPSSGSDVSLETEPSGSSSLLVTSTINSASMMLTDSAAVVTEASCSRIEARVPVPDGALSSEKPPSWLSMKCQTLAI